MEEASCGGKGQPRGGGASTAAHRRTQNMDRYILHFVPSWLPVFPFPFPLDRYIIIIIIRPKGIELTFLLFNSRQNKTKKLKATCPAEHF